MNKIVIALIVVTVILAVIYFFPVPHHDFAELSENVDPEVRQSLLDFRKNYPAKSVNVSGYDWEYVTIGDGEETILFLHGMTGAYDIWWQQMVTLSDQYKVISLTYPPVDTLKGMSHGVLAVLDAEGVESANVVGTSLGGYLVQYMVANYPNRIEKAVYANTFPPNDLIKEKNESLIKVLPFIPEWLVMKILRGSIEEEIYPASGYSELVLAYMLEQVSGRMRKNQVIARAKVVIEPFTPPDPEDTKISVMIIEADNDPLVEKSLREQLKTTYPSAEVHTLHAVGHFSYLNIPEEYTSLLIDFFGQ